jgi:methyl-accepting chemotaxis protein
MEAASNQGPKRVRRRTFLIDRKFQLKYTMIIVLVGVVVSALLGYFIYRLNQENRDLLGIDETMMAEVQKIDSYTMYYLVGFVVVMAVVLFIWGIFITHRVAGPIFIISRYLRQLGQGDVPQTRPLRKGDELKEFFDTFSGMLNSLKQRNVEEAQLLEKIAVQIGSTGGGAPGEIAEALNELAAKKKAWGEPSSS